MAKRYQRLLVAACLLCTFLLTSRLFAPARLACLGMDVRGLMTHLAVLADEERVRASYAARARVFIDAIMAKQGVAHEALMGRLPLRGAAARFQELDESCPEFNWEHFRETVPGRNDEERQCRQVIESARLLVEAGATHDADGLVRLRQEFFRTFDADAEPSL